MTDINAAAIRSRSGPYADVEATIAALEAVVAVADAAQPAVGAKVYLPFSINDTDLAAGTAQNLIAPAAGSISKVSTIIQVAIVTGGAITVKVGTTDVVGLSITVADSATEGTVQSDTPTVDGTEVVTAGQRIQIVPSAAFNGGGAVNGVLELTLS